MKKSEEIRKTSNSRVNRLLERQYNISCPYCSPHQGCNRYNFNNNWKEYRKTQWKEVKNEA